MGAKQKFKDHYPSEDQNKRDKEEIKAYLEKISTMLQDPKNQKKAAQIISQLINKSSK